MPHVVETRSATISLREDGLVHLLVHPGARVTEADAEENLSHMPQQPYRLLVESRHIGSMSAGARRAYAGPLAHRALAVAIVLESPLSRVIGNFFITLSKPRYPTKLFTSIEAAEQWLARFAPRG